MKKIEKTLKEKKNVISQISDKKCLTKEANNVIKSKESFASKSWASTWS